MNKHNLKPSMENENESYPAWGRPLNEPGLSFFALLDFDFFTDEWHMAPVVTSNSQILCARVHMISHVKMPPEWKENVEKTPFSTTCAFVELWHPFQRPFLWSDALICIILQYLFSDHIPGIRNIFRKSLISSNPCAPLASICEEKHLTFIHVMSDWISKTFKEEVPIIFLSNFSKALFIKVKLRDY